MVYVITLLLMFTLSGSTKLYTNEQINCILIEQNIKSSYSDTSSCHLLPSLVTCQYRNTSQLSSTI